MSQPTDFYNDLNQPLHDIARDLVYEEAVISTLLEEDTEETELEEAFLQLPSNSDDQWGEA